MFYKRRHYPNLPRNFAIHDLYLTDSLWWLLGAIVSFYFGARHQIKSIEIRAQDMQKQAHTIAQSLQTNAIKHVRAIHENAAVSEWRNGT